MRDVSDGGAPPHGPLAFLLAGLLAGTIMAIWLLMQGQALLAAFLAYSLGGAASVMAAAALSTLRCRLIGAMATSQPGRD